MANTIRSHDVSAEPAASYLLGNYPPAREAPRFEVDLDGVPVTIVEFTADSWAALPAEGRPDAWTSTDGRKVMAIVPRPD